MDLLKAYWLTAWEPQSIGDEVREMVPNKILGKPLTEDKLIKDVQTCSGMTYCICYNLRMDYSRIK